MHIFVGVRQSSLLSPTLFNIFHEHIISDAIEELYGIVSIVGWVVTSLRFADDTDGMAGAQELASLVNRLGRMSSIYGKEISAEKTKLMTEKKFSR